MTLFEKPNDYLLSLKPGDTLTIKGEIFDIAGNTLFNNEKVIIEEVLKDPAKYSKVFNMYYAEKVTGFKIKDKYGIWFLNTFEETKQFKQ